MKNELSVLICSIIMMLNISNLYAQTSNDNKFYLGGSIGYYDKYIIDDEESEDNVNLTSYGFSFYTGYELNSKISIGAQFEYQLSNFHQFWPFHDNKYITIGAYLRYNIKEFRKCAIFLQLNSALGFYNYQYYYRGNMNYHDKAGWKEVSFAPGYLYNFNKKLSLKGTFGDIKYFIIDFGYHPYHNSRKGKILDVNLLSNVSIGLQYNF